MLLNIHQATSIGIISSHQIQRKIARNAIAFVLGISLLMGLLPPVIFIVMNFVSPNLYSRCLTYSFMNSLRTVYFAQLMFACNTLNERFKSLNYSISGLTSEKSDKVFHRRHLTIFHHKEFVQLYHTLCDAIDMVNEAFTPHFIPLLANVLVRIDELIGI